MDAPGTPRTQQFPACRSDQWCGILEIDAGVRRQQPRQCIEAGWQQAERIRWVEEYDIEGRLWIGVSQKV
jgi:hypothetical protein